MKATNETRDPSAALAVLLRAQDKAEGAAESFACVEALLKRAAKKLAKPEREKLLAIAASLPDVAGEIETVLEAIADVRTDIEREVTELEAKGGAA